MNREEAIKTIGFHIDSVIRNDKLDDSKLGYGFISDHTQQLVDSWEYVKENLK